MHIDDDAIKNLSNFDLMNDYARAKVKDLTFQPEKIWEKELRLKLGHELMRRLESETRLTK